MNFPFLKFGNVVWVPFSSSGDQKQLQQVQVNQRRRATLKLEHINDQVPSPPRATGSPSYRRYASAAAEETELFHGGIDMPPAAVFTSNENELTRGHSWKLFEPRAMTDTRQTTQLRRQKNHQRLEGSTCWRRFCRVAFNIQGEIGLALGALLGYRYPLTITNPDS